MDSARRRDFRHSAWRFAVSTGSRVLYLVFRTCGCFHSRSTPFNQRLISWMTQIIQASGSGIQIIVVICPSSEEMHMNVSYSISAALFRNNSPVWIFTLWSHYTATRASSSFNGRKRQWFVACRATFSVSANKVSNRSISFSSYSILELASIDGTVVLVGIRCAISSESEVFLEATAPRASRSSGHIGSWIGHCSREEYIASTCVLFHVKVRRITCT